MHRTLSRALRYSCALATLGLAWACGSDNNPVNVVDLLDGKLNLELGGSGTGTVTLVSSNLSYSGGSCSTIESPCEWSTDLDEHGTTTLTLTAVPDAGSSFTSWAGNCPVVSGTPTQATVAMNAEITYDCFAEFTLNAAATCSPAFGETDWITPVWDIVVVSGDGAVSQSFSLVNTGGNPSGPTFGGLENPSFRKMTHDMDLPVGISGTSRIVVAQFPQGGLLIPTGLVKMVYREDQITISNPDALPITWGMAVRQDGTVYLAPLGIFNSPTWQRQAVDVRQANFTAPEPDFTQPFEVGFFRSTTIGANPADGSTVEHGIDNWQIEVCQ